MPYWYEVLSDWLSVVSVSSEQLTVCVVFERVWYLYYMWSLSWQIFFCQTDRVWIVTGAPGVDWTKKLAWGILAWSQWSSRTVERDLGLKGTPEGVSTPIGSQNGSTKDYMGPKIIWVPKIICMKLYFLALAAVNRITCKIFFFILKTKY